MQNCTTRLDVEVSREEHSPFVALRLRSSEYLWHTTRTVLRDDRRGQCVDRVKEGLTSPLQ